MKILFSRGYRVLFLLLSLGLHTACINQLEDEETPAEGQTPICFTAVVQQPQTKVQNAGLDNGDRLGLFAVLSGKGVNGARYIDNLLLTSGDDDVLTPSRQVFYPEGDADLDFYSYHPYSETGMAEGSATLSLQVAPQQTDVESLSQSDFLVAKKTQISAGNEPVALQYSHKLAKITLTLQGDEELLKTKPQIMATGFMTQATYNFATDELTPTGEPCDITLDGNWTVNNGTLSGIEMIVIPQAIDNEKQLQLNWNGNVYTCTFPDECDKVESGKNLKIEISSIQQNSYVLSSVKATVTPWDDTADPKSTAPSTTLPSVTTALLNFKISNVYRIYHGGAPIAEICKEYLHPSLGDSYQALVSYPVQSNGSTDLSQGTILCRLDKTAEAVHGGTVSWDTGNNTCTLSEGTSPAFQRVYYDATGQAATQSSSSTVPIQVRAETLRDLRGTTLRRYPIVKVATQYWMRENLKATTYLNGSAIPSLSTLNGTACYVKPSDSNLDIIYYSGEILAKPSFLPDGWKIPTTNEWKALCDYTGSVADLKDNVWQLPTSASSSDVLQPVTNYTMMGILAVGYWTTGINNLYQKVAYWCMDNTNPAQIATNSPLFTSTSDEISGIRSKVENQSYYKAMVIRCLKK